MSQPDQPGPDSVSPTTPTPDPLPIPSPSSVPVAAAPDTATISGLNTINTGESVQPTAPNTSTASPAPPPTAPVLQDPQASTPARSTSPILPSQGVQSQSAVPPSQNLELTPQPEQLSTPIQPAQQAQKHTAAASEISHEAEKPVTISVVNSSPSNSAPAKDKASSQAVPSSPARSRPSSVVFVEAPEPTKEATSFPPPATPVLQKAIPQPEKGGQTPVEAVAVKATELPNPELSVKPVPEVVVSKSPEHSPKQGESDATAKPIVNVVFDTPPDKVVTSSHHDEKAPLAGPIVPPLEVTLDNDKPLVKAPAPRAVIFESPIAVLESPNPVATKAPVLEHSLPEIERIQEPTEKPLGDTLNSIVSTGSNSSPIHYLVKTKRSEKLRQRVCLGYWKSWHRKNHRQRLERHLRPRKRDLIRAKVLSGPILGFLIGSKPCRVVKPIIDESANTPRGLYGHVDQKLEGLKRSFFAKTHERAQRHHLVKADLHSKLGHHAKLDNFFEAQKHHAERVAHHLRRAQGHAEKEVRGRKRFAEQEILAAEQRVIQNDHRNEKWLEAADKNANTSKYHEERYAKAEDHLREARRNLESRIQHGRRRLDIEQRALRDPLHRLGREKLMTEPKLELPDVHDDRSNQQNDREGRRFEDEKEKLKSHQFRNREGRAPASARVVIGSTRENGKNNATADSHPALEHDNRLARVSVENLASKKPPENKETAGVAHVTILDGATPSKPIPSNWRPLATNESLKYDQRARPPSIRSTTSKGSSQSSVRSSNSNISLQSSERLSNSLAPSAIHEQGDFRGNHSEQDVGRPSSHKSPSPRRMKWSFKYWLKHSILRSKKRRESRKMGNQHHPRVTERFSDEKGDEIRKQNPMLSPSHPNSQENLHIESATVSRPRSILRRSLDSELSH